MINISYDSFLQFTYFWMALGLLTLIFLIFSNIRAPYGRHTTAKFGPMISNKWGWFWMEIPALLMVPLFVVIKNTGNSTVLYLTVLWTIHYGFRTLIFPFRLNTKGKKMPLLIMVSGLFFNLINGFVNGYYMTHFQMENTTLVFIILGTLLFFLGMYINRTSDRYLISLRTKNSNYQIPKKGLFQWISCPNHFGEILEWAGYALIAWTPAALSFFVWTISNLAPRAANHHKWYKETFEDYPKNRKALIPFLW